MKNPRRSVQQTNMAMREREAIQKVKDDEMSRKLREAYKRSQSRSVSGMNKGGMAIIIEAEEPEMEDEMEDEYEMSEGGSLRMVEKGGKKIPFFAADGKGKMFGGGMTYGPAAKSVRDTFRGGGMTKVRTSGKRDGVAIRGKTKGRFV